LIEKGADVNAQNFFGNTPLFVALMNYSDGRKDVIMLMIKAGADKDIKNKRGVSPYQLAMNVTNHDLKQFFK
jgi:ankyrin repeat protein